MKEEGRRKRMVVLLGAIFSSCFPCLGNVCTGCVMCCNVLMVRDNYEIWSQGMATNTLPREEAQLHTVTAGRQRRGMVCRVRYDNVLLLEGASH